MWFRENPPKQVISISPSYNYSAVPFQQYAPQAAGDFIVVFIEGKKKIIPADCFSNVNIFVL
jgi:hypothetical protein